MNLNEERITLNEARMYVRWLEAFKGRESAEYTHLLEPLAKFVYEADITYLPLIGKLAERLLASAPETVTGETTPSVTADFVAERVKPWIEEVRQRLFHSETAPFSRIEDAQMWWDEAEKRMDEWSKSVDEWISRTDEWPGTERMDVGENRSAGRPPEPWPLLKPSERHAPPPVPKAPPRAEEDEQLRAYIGLLYDGVEISDVTGFTLKSVKMWILAGAAPLLPTYTLGILNRSHALPDGTHVSNRFARVTVRGELKFEDLRALYGEIKRRLGTRGSKRPTKKQLEVYRLVTRNGDTPPHEGKVAFWERKKDEWNREHPKDKYTTWKGIKGAYDRPRKKMATRTQVGEAQPIEEG